MTENITRWDQTLYIVTCVPANAHQEPRQAIAVEWNSGLIEYVPKESLDPGLWIVFERACAARPDGKFKWHPDLDSESDGVPA